MSEVKMISPLLDDMIVENERIGQNGQICHTLRNQKTGEQFILRSISMPESDSRIRALILSGAYPDEQSVHTYYSTLAEDMKAELQLGQKLSASGSFAAAVSYQVEAKKSGVGYDIYILYPMSIPLNEFLSMNAMTRLRALNLGIDLCDSIIACREAGYLFQNIRPENIFLTRSDKFLLGGLGLTALEYLQYACVPEEYLGTYSAPELSDIMANANPTIDLYSLGMVLYRIYNGNHDPFEDEGTNAAMAEKLRLSGKPLPTPLYADYELAEIILKACSFKQEDRYQSPEEFKQALVLYMQRNEVSDELIAPPIVADIAPITAEDEDSEIEPIRMTDAKDLDENFRQNFAPNMAGAGDETIEETPVEESEEVPEEPSEEAPIAEEAPTTVEEPVAEDDPATEEAPVEETLVEEAPIEEAPVEQSLVEAEEPVSDEIAEEIDELADDQMDLDTLLASVNAVVGDIDEPIDETDNEDEESLPDEAPVTHDYIDSANDDPSEEEENAEPQKRPRIFLWSAIITAVIAVALVAYFLLNWYFVDVSELKTVYTTPNQIMVELVTNDNPEHFKVTCTDAFGNVYESLRSGKQYCFTELEENTTYTITVSAAENHEFPVAAPSLTETTASYTAISDITFDRLEQDGAFRLSFKHTGPTPDLWELTYYKKGDSNSTNTFVFRGDYVDLQDLALYETYVFSISDAGGVFMLNEGTAEYKVYPHVEVKNFAFDNFNGNDVILKWDCDTTDPQEWAIVCMAEGMEDITLKTDKTTATVTVPDFAKEYHFYLSSLGMDEAQELVLEANPIIASNLTAQVNRSGEIVVSWEAPGAKPDGGWLVNYRLNNVYYETNGPTVTCEASAETTVTLKYLPANADLTITLIPVGTETTYGNLTLEVRTTEADPFVDYQIRPAAPYGDNTNLTSLIALWQKPDKEKWDYRDLRTARRTTYTPAELIAFCVQIDSCDLSAAVIDDEAHLTYAVRDENGTIVACEFIEYTDDSKPLTWSGVWFDRRHTGTIPTPYSATELGEDGKPVVLTGNFTFELYINGQLLATKSFTIES